MTGNASTYLQAQRINWWKGTAHAASPAHVNVALYTTMPDQAGAGGVEVSAGDYARVSIAPGGWGAITGTGPWSIATSGVTTFATSTVNAWGTILGFALFDPSGNLLNIDAFAQPIVVSVGVPVAFAAGQISVTEGGAASQYLAQARLNWIKGGAYPAPPSEVWAALYTTMPSAADTGGVEANWTGYARSGVVSASGWSALTGTNPTTITNDALMDYGAAGAGTPVTILGYGWRDAASAGNLLELYTFASGLAVNNGADVSAAIGAVGVSSD